MSQLTLQKIDTTKLQELTEVIIDTSAPVEERISNYLWQIENPFCFKVNGTPVKISFTNHNKMLKDSLYNYLRDKKQLDTTIL